jgi:hypothetical protein
MDIAFLRIVGDIDRRPDATQLTQSRKPQLAEKLTEV